MIHKWFINLMYWKSLLILPLLGSINVFAVQIFTTLYLKHEIIPPLWHVANFSEAPSIRTSSSWCCMHNLWKPIIMFSCSRLCNSTKRAIITYYCVNEKNKCVQWLWLTDQRHPIPTWKYKKITFVSEYDLIVIITWFSSCKSIGANIKCMFIGAQVFLKLSKVSTRCTSEDQPSRLWTFCLL